MNDNKLGSQDKIAAQYNINFTKRTYYIIVKALGNCFLGYTMKFEQYLNWVKWFDGSYLQAVSSKQIYNMLKYD